MIDERKDEASVQNMQLKKDLEAIKNEKDILITKLKKMQKLAAKVPALEHENVSLRESLKTNSQDVAGFAKSERELILVQNLTMTLAQQQELDKRLELEIAEKKALQDKLRK